MIRKILVANHGETAIRMIRSCWEMEVTSIAIFSEISRITKHVPYADEAYCVGPAASRESYLNIEKIIEVVKEYHADVIHPRYGSLSENATFARRCQEKNIIFIGPDSGTMEIVSDKVPARIKMIEAGVPVVPGTQKNLESMEEAVKFCNRISYPMMLRAFMGGGGKDMCPIHSVEEVEEAYTTTKSESFSSFDDDTVYLEKFVEEPHHTEFQILGDRRGNVIRLYEHERSAQHRNQKIVEETPLVFVTPELRKDTGEKTIAAVKVVNYVGTGTTELLADEHHDYRFLEMSTRLQAEHPVTEKVVGAGSMKEQIKVADDQALQLKQKDIRQCGHVIECRICAEDTETNFIPSPGIIRQITEPDGIGVRIDSCVYEGYEIPIYHDPMIGKLIVWATNRKYAIGRVRRVLHEYKLTGVKNNISYLHAIMGIPGFVGGHYDTGFIIENDKHLQQCIIRASERAESVAMIAAYVDYLMNLEENRGDTTDDRSTNKWKEFGLHKGILRI